MTELSCLCVRTAIISDGITTGSRPSVPIAMGAVRIATGASSNTRKVGNPGGGNSAMPDLRRRYPYNLDSGGSGRITSAGGNWDGTVLGNTGGAQNRTIAQNQLPNVVPSFSGTPATITSNQSDVANYNTGVAFEPAGSGNVGAVVFPVGDNPSVGPVTANYTPAGAVSSINGNVSQQATPTLPPSMGIYFMMRIQ